MPTAEALNITISRLSSRVQLQLGDLWYHQRGFDRNDYEVLLVRWFETDKQGYTYVNLLSLTHGDDYNIRTVDANIVTGRVWPMKAA
jgi:hypothetical protein